MILTLNEKRVLRLLATSVKRDLSMNDVAKACGISSGGAFKILTKLEKEGVLKAKPIANIKSYKLDFISSKTNNILELALIPDMMEGRIEARAADLKPLQATSQACVLFGSYITAKQKPSDLDVLLVLERTKFERYKQALAKVQDLVPVKIQDVVQTRHDLAQNLKKNDPVVTEALRNGIVLWGFTVLVQVIKDATG